MTAPAPTPTLTDADRALVLAPCGCGHDLNDHGSVCWECFDDGRDCTVTFESLLTEAVAAIKTAAVAEALTEAADAIGTKRVYGNDLLDMELGVNEGYEHAISMLRDRAARIPT